MIVKSIIVLCLLQVLIGTSYGDWRTFDYSFIENELKTTGSNHVEFKQVADTPVVYRAWGVWNLPHPVSEVAKVALNFGYYPHVFRYVYRCDRIVEPKRRLSSLGTWYVEGRAGIARVWAIGNIDSVRWTDSTQLRFLAHQNEDRRLEARWWYNERGWLNFRTHGVRLAALIVPAGRDSCRIGIVTQGWVKKPMPQWLVRLATSIILPQLLQDLEKEVTRRAQLSKPKEAPWYNKWYSNARRLFSPKAPQTNK